jgi:hypothetical protein
MNKLRARFIEIEKIVGQERFGDWFLSAIETYKPKIHSTEELRNHVENHIEREYNNYQVDIAYKIMLQCGGSQDEV